MRQSISYTFLLNTVILFIFVCMSVIMGIFSYNRAFKANTIVIDSIEKYEGYNCLSEEEIARKLNNISYNVPFTVECKDHYGTPCMTDLNNNYAVVSYNLDYSADKYVEVGRNNKNYSDDYKEMNSMYKCDQYHCQNTKKYQYGVYTYMYVDLPVVSSLLKIPFFSKTRIMYEFRDIYEKGATNVLEQKNAYDSRNIYDLDSYKETIESIGLELFLIQYGAEMQIFESQLGAGNLNGKMFIKTDPEYNARKAMQLRPLNTPPDITTVAFVKEGFPYECGFKRDYSQY